MRGIDAFSGKGKRWFTSILLLVAMAALPLLFLYRNTPNTPELQLGTTGLLRSRHQFSSYEEYLELQMKKTSNPRLRRLWTSRDWRRKVEVFSGIFARLARSELLRPGSKALCIGARVGQEVVALKENGVQDFVGIDLIPAPPLVIKGDIHLHPFPNNTFDFEFSNVFDHALYPDRFISEIERTLKPGGIAVLHLIVKHRGDKYSANDLFSIDPLLQLFRSSEILSVREVDAFGLDTKLIIRKKPNNLLTGRCSPKVPPDTMERAEPLISEEPRKPWSTLKRNVANIRYLPELLTGQGLRGRTRHVYIDVGSRNYGSSIGGWFHKAYPKQGMNFSVFAIEADRAFHRDYETRKKKVTLIPYAAWVRNETLRFFTKGGGMGRIVNNSTGEGAVADAEEGEMREVKGFDFAEWLGRSVRASDYVVMKMDVEGAEFELLPRLVESGGICLVDELFLECHYNRWQKCCPDRTDKYRHTYEQCLDLFRTLRSSGVLVHQWCEVLNGFCTSGSFFLAFNIFQNNQESNQLLFRCVFYLL